MCIKLCSERSEAFFGSPLSCITSFNQDKKNRSSFDVMAKSLSFFLLLAALLATSAYADHWGSFKNNGCVQGRKGLRDWSSRLWGIKGSWEDACNRKGHCFGGRCFTKPHHCVNRGGGGGMWGVFYVPDSSCN